MVFIRFKSFNILIFILTIFVSAAVVHGTNVKIDENTIYLLEKINNFEIVVKNERVNVENLKHEIEVEKGKMVSVNESEYFDTIIEMNKNIQELKHYNGFTDVRGPGIIMRVSDSVSEDETIDIMDKIVHDVDITVLINDLKSAGAEAIIINGKRIINISEVVCAGPLLKINGDSVSAPFLISAIGDPEALYNAVNEEGTYAYELKNVWGMEVATMKSYNLFISKLPKFFEENYEIQYAEIAE
ncbi:MAG: DUF881 domain-containing protein [Tissierellia bacterium]|nr:DUF881 domain-containing protein [Tissierellia bacterium]